MRRLVVVGASLAGLRAAQAARAAGYDGELVVVGDEPHKPYTRPPLSKELLKGVQAPEQCGLPHGTVDVTWRLGAPATGLDRARRRVGLGNGDEIPYDRLIIATGCRARPWPGVGGERAGVLTLRSLDDSLALRAALESGARLLIVGAGFIGCEVAASARALGCPVTVVDIAAQPMLPLGPELGERCLRLHREHGVDVRCATGIEALLGRERVRGARLTDGTTVEADVVLMALGAVPNVDWLHGSGLAIAGGLVCDPTLTTTSDPDVLAAGDVARWPPPLAGGQPIRVEHWTTAAEHGQLAGRNALLAPEDRRIHDVPPYFWSDQYDVKIQAVGFPALAEHLEVIEQSPDATRLVAVGAHAGRVVGVVAVNAAKRLAWYRRQLAVESANADSIAGSASNPRRQPPALEDLRAAVAADDRALGTAVEAVESANADSIAGSASPNVESANPAAGAGSMKPALVLQHGEWGPPGLLAEWAAERGITLEIHRSDLGQPLPAVDGHAFIASLGSKHSPVDRDRVPAVAAELDFIAQAVDAGVPVLGLCYGGQVLASVLGGQIETAPEPELGWHAVSSMAPDRVPEGPWLQWHYHRFTLPAGAVELARSPRALQAFAHGPHLGVQFHPESTIEIVQGWARLDGERLRALGIADGEALVESGRDRAGAARHAAYELFDAFWSRAHQSERRDP